MNIKKFLFVFISLFCFSHLFAQTTDFSVSPKKTVNVHGMRVPENSASFELVSHSFEKVTKKIQIDFIFNQGINPISVKNGTIKINGEPLQLDSSYVIFSKDGKTMRLIFDLKMDKFSLSLENIESLSGNVLKKVEVNFE